MIQSLRFFRTLSVWSLVLLVFPTCSSDARRTAGSVGTVLQAATSSGSFSCEDTTCCPNGTKITKLTTAGSYSDSTGNACIFATPAADIVFSSGPNTTISGGGGDDIIFASAPGVRIFGGEG